MDTQSSTTSLTFEEIFLGFLIALAAGALIGLEREQSAAPPRKRLGGVRTFPLIALSGALSALLAHPMGALPVVLALLVIGMFLTVSYYQERRDEGLHGMTTEVAALITFLLGVLALFPGLPLATAQRYLLIVASAAVVMALLSFKEPLHKAVARLSVNDIYSTARFVILALVILPLLPNRTIGPLDVFNPFHTGLMVVLVAGMSFVGFVAIRVIGERHGLPLTGLIGGMVSSTAVTISLASRRSLSPPGTRLAASGILAASGTTFVRMLIIVSIVDPALWPALAAPLGAMTIASYTMALLLWSGSSPELSHDEPVPHRNPFELRPALQFGILYTAVLFVTKGGQSLYGEPGLYLTSVLAGAANVDAVTLSVTRLHEAGLPAAAGAVAITLAALISAVAKAALAHWFGRWPLAARVWPGLGATVLTGGLVLVFIW